VGQAKRSPTSFAKNKGPECLFKKSSRKGWCEMKKQVNWLRILEWIILLVVVVYLVSKDFLPLCARHIYDINSGHITALSESILALVAILALGVAWYQIQSFKQSQKEAIAKDIYTGYLKLAIEHPDESRIDKKEITRDSVPGNDKSSSSTENKYNATYDAFMTYLLFAAEEILDLFPNDKEWKNALTLDLSHHKAYFKSPDYKNNDVESYTEPLRELVKEILLKDLLYKPDKL
jgi:hypothetical protein